MIPQIDADVLRYEIGSIGDIDGPKSFDFVASVLDGRIEDICHAVNATGPPVLYLTGKGNFRDAVAFTKPYKGNRDNKEKPFHFENLTVYMKNQYTVVVAEGMEADDLMSVEQMRSYKEHGDWSHTIICTRDKDLRMVPGFHYGWECGKQREFGPLLVKNDGGRVKYDRAKRKITGVGDAFFWSQMLTGDPTDNIPGCPGIGPKKAYEILSKDDPRTLWQKVYDTYRDKGCSEDMILEQGQLLWMVRELNEDGSPVMWSLPDDA